MKTSKLILTSKLRWEIFGCGMLIGSFWGACSFLLGTFLFRFPDFFITEGFGLPAWILVRYFVVVGMAFGVAFSSLYAFEKPKSTLFTQLVSPASAAFRKSLHSAKAELSDLPTLHLFPLASLGSHKDF